MGQSLDRYLGALFGVTKEPSPPCFILRLCLRFGDVVEQCGQFQQCPSCMAVGGMLFEMRLAVRGPRHAGLDGRVLVPLCDEFRRLDGLHRMSPNVPVMHIWLIDTLGGLKFRYHLFKEAKVVKHFYLSLGAVQ